MKARLFPRLVAGLVATLAVLTIQRSAATSTVPNASKTTFTIAAGNQSPKFAIGSRNTPVLVMVAGLENYRYCSSFTFTCTDANNAIFMSYVGIDYAGGVHSGAVDSTLNDVAAGPAVPGVYLRTSFEAGKLYFASGNQAVVKLIVTQIW